MPKTPAQATLDAIVKAYIAPTTRAAGFRKQAANFRRRHGETAQVINLQSSQWSTSTAKNVMVNVSIDFDAICIAEGKAIVQHPTTGYSSFRLCVRIERLVDGCPAGWDVQASDDPAVVGVPLGDAIAEVVAKLGGIDSLAAFRLHPWFQREHVHYADVVGRTLYLLGEDDATRTWVAWRADTLAACRDKTPARITTEMIQRMGFTRLTPAPASPMGTATSGREAPDPP